MPPSVYQYWNYREYLKDYVSARKAALPRYSLTTLGRGAQGISKAHLSLILHGKRNVAPARIESLGRALRLPASELRYFQCLVLFNQAKGAGERSFYLEQLASQRPRTPEAQLLATQYQVLRNWHCLLLRELIQLPGFENNPQQISRRFKGRMKPSEAAAALETLLQAGLVKENANGSYVLTEKKIRTSDEIQSLLIQSYHQTCLDLAKQVLETDSLEQREFASVNLALTPTQFQALKQQLKVFRDQAAEAEGSADGEKKKVYQLNFQLIEVAE